MAFIIWCIVFVLINCLDLVATYAAMGNKSASEMQKHEMNPFFDSILANKPLTWIIKMAGTGFIVGLLFATWRVANKTDAEYYLRLIAALSILIIFVVVNNIHARWADDHHRLSLGKFVTKKVHLPKLLAFYLIVFALFGLSFGIAHIFY